MLWLSRVAIWAAESSRQSWMFFVFGAYFVTAAGRRFWGSAISKGVSLVFCFLMLEKRNLRSLVISGTGHDRDHRFPVDDPDLSGQIAN